MYERFIARQPILDAKLALQGYKLIFRARPGLRFAEAENSAAHLISASLMLFHWESLFGRASAFFGMSESELLQGAALLLPATQTVIELPASLPAQPEILETLERLRRAKYRVALDSFCGEGTAPEIVGRADFLKVNFQSTSESQIKLISECLGQGSAKLLATGIDDWREFQHAKTLGFTLFQGNFIAQPVFTQRKDVPASQLNCLRLLWAANEKPLNLPKVEAVLKEEPGLTYKLLRYLNSPALGRAAEIKSVGNAVALLGDQEFRRWATVVSATSPNNEKPSELIRTALRRAFFCEELARVRKEHDCYEYFLAGLLSVMSAIVDQPLKEIICELAISSELRGALEGKPCGLRYALDAALAFEQGRWEEFSQAVELLSVPQDILPDCALEADRATRTLLM